MVTPSLQEPFPWKSSFPKATILIAITFIILLILVRNVDAIRRKSDYKSQHAQAKRRRKLRRQKTQRDLGDIALKPNNDEHISNFPSDYTSHSIENFTSGYGSTLR